MSESTTGDSAVPEAESGPAADESGTGTPETPEATDSRIAGADENTPPVPDEIREAARLAPDHWLGMVDPTWSGEGEPPEWATVGRWRSSPEGEIVEWQDNPEYRPSPRALGWPEPEDEVDQAVQLAATGYGPGEAVTRELADYEVAVLTAPGGGLLSVTTPDGAAAVPLYTSPVYLHTSGRFGFELMRVDREFLDQVPEGHLLYLNPSGPVSMTLETGPVREAVEGTGSTESTEETDGRSDEGPAGKSEETGGPAGEGSPAPTAPAAAPVPMITTSSDVPAAPGSGAPDSAGDAEAGTGTEADDTRADNTAASGGGDGENEALDAAAQAQRILSGDTSQERKA
ncbi:type VII secretion system-associated protein [Streptomyces sp. TRM 70361]|uniref:type VII secretion system-associated protein n=1 Tax=Streptomyces sp. TRM 70361 TaxID=3116553 RepID=UPI002E7C4F1C|nr:type VII secretion system-associated protein [Streptomyces sp. TRM 70361]MEE1940104.1 type VII secretion system-associated protein [Streptomyces sp. TRM 70361]